MYIVKFSRSTTFMAVEDTIRWFNLCRYSTHQYQGCIITPSSPSRQGSTLETMSGHVKRIVFEIKRYLCNAIIRIETGDDRTISHPFINRSRVYIAYWITTLIRDIKIGMGVAHRKTGWYKLCSQIPMQRTSSQVMLPQIGLTVTWVFQDSCKRLQLLACFEMIHTSAWKSRKTHSAHSLANVVGPADGIWNETSSKFCATVTDLANARDRRCISGSYKLNRDVSKWEEIKSSNFPSLANSNQRWSLHCLNRCI